MPHGARPSLVKTDLGKAMLTTEEAHVGVAVDSASIQLPSFAHVGAPPERQIETKAAVAGVQNTGESHSFWQRRHQKPVDLVVDD